VTSSVRRNPTLKLAMPISTDRTTSVHLIDALYAAKHVQVKLGRRPRFRLSVIQRPATEDAGGPSNG
jgi:hypothetical protein